VCIGSEEDLEKLKRIGRIVALTREEMLRHVRPGVTTAELDAIGAEVMERHGATSAPKAEYGFPGATCISLNDQAAHGIPGSTTVREGDLVNVDVSAELDGYYADTGATVAVPPAADAALALCQCSYDALLRGLDRARSGVPIHGIGRAIYREAHSRGFTVIRNLAGHGIGRKLHEPPDVFNFFARGDDRPLEDGQVLAVETFVSAGAQLVMEDPDGWGLRTPDGSLVAQFEHTIVVTAGRPIVLTAL